MGWIGVGLDGTLAVYDEWVGIDHIGEPIPKMVNRVKNWLAVGRSVKIMTARVGPQPNGEPCPQNVIEAIQQWCKEHIGQVLPVTHSKDFGMIELWDDRAIQIITNTGERADGEPLESYVQNCVFAMDHIKVGLGNHFHQKQNGEILARLDGIALTTVEEYDRLREIEKLAELPK